MKKEKKATNETVRARIDFDTAKPRQIEAYFKEVIRKAHGDTVENRAVVYARRGYYEIEFQLANKRLVHFDNFRRQDAPRVAKAIRALAAA